MTKKKGKISKMFKKMKGTSNLEVSFGELLDSLEIKYIPHFIFKNREYDFLLTEHSILVETHGCFYHCCKTHYPETKYPFQRKNLKNDQYKIKNVKFDKTYTLVIFWEHEMKDSKKVKKKLKESIEKYSKVING
jgi:G:T-mismatch repair DNA endonuclease (very short patch repair protein)